MTGGEMKRSGCFKETQVFTGAQKGTRACYRVTHNTVTCVTRHNFENAPVFQQVLPPHKEN